MEPLHFDTLPKHCIDKFRISNPELSYLPDDEIELFVCGNFATVVYSMYDVIRGFLKSASDKVTEEQKNQLWKEALETLRHRLLFFNDMSGAFESLCGTTKEVEAFLNSEGKVFIEVFKGLVVKYMRYFYQDFVICFSKNPSYESLLHAHETINKMWLEAKTEIGVGDDFQDKLRWVVIEQCESLLEYYHKEMSRYQSKHFMNSSIGDNKAHVHLYGVKNNNAPSYNKKGGELAITFDGLFTTPYNNYIDDFVDILYRCEPQVITNDCKLVKKADNGILRIFFDVLGKNGIIQYRLTRKTYGKIIAEKFSGLKASFIDSQAVDNKIVHIKCRAYFEEEINKRQKTIDKTI